MRKKAAPGHPFLPAGADRLSSPHRQGACRARLASAAALGAGAAALGAGLLAGAQVAHADALTPPIVEPRDVAGNRPMPRFDPIGYDLSGFDLFPSVKFGARADDNVLFSNHQRKADASFQVEPRLRVVRKANGSSLAIDLHARQTLFARLTEQNSTEYGLRAVYRHGGELSWYSLGAGYRREVIQRGTVENDLVGGPPLLRRVLDGTLGLHKQFGRLAIDSRLDASRIRYEPLPGVADQRFRDGERYGAQLALAYEISGRTSLFASGSYQRFDYRPSPAVGNRDADDWSGLIGVRYDLSRIFIAQLGAGYRTHHFLDPRQKPISGPAISAQLRYYPTRLLSVRGDINQTITTSPYDLVSAVTVTTGRVELEYERRRNLSMLASGTVTFEDYGHAAYSARSLSLSAGPVWRINTWLRADASIAYTQRFVRGTAPFEPYRQLAGMFSLTVSR